MAVLTPGYAYTSEAEPEDFAGPTSTNCWKVKDDGEIVAWWPRVNSCGKLLVPYLLPSGVVFKMEGAKISPGEIPVVRTVLGLCDQGNR